MLKKEVLNYSIRDVRNNSVGSTPRRNNSVGSTPRRNIFFMNMFLPRRSSYPDSPPTSNQFQYPRQDQMTLNILPLCV